MIENVKTQRSASPRTIFCSNKKNLCPFVLSPLSLKSKTPQAIQLLRGFFSKDLRFLDVSHSKNLLRALESQDLSVLKINNNQLNLFYFLSRFCFSILACSKCAVKPAILFDAQSLTSSS